ncbi:DNA-binding response regulator [bacterium]|nr:MAG: DNA-binding response regulator [bacterium]
MYTAIIIDDEPNAIASLNLMIKEFLSDRIKVVDTATSVKQGAEKIKKHKPELVFLDIEMPNDKGFELFKYFDQDVNFDVIFTTAYEQYMIDALRRSALDYLLKPVQWLEIRDSLKRLEQRKAQDVPLRQIEMQLANLQPNYDLNKIAIPTANGYEMFAVREILYCEGDGNYSRIVTTSERTVVVSKTLQWLEETLPMDFFFRIHKSHIVNLGHVKTYDKAAGNILILDNGKELEVAHRRNEDLVARLQNK